MPSFRDPLCYYCTHRNTDNKRTCAAFPELIPEDIYYRSGDHTTPVAGDNGIVFTFKDGINHKRWLRHFGDTALGRQIKEKSLVAGSSS